ncbi:MAG: GNAT family N-acetyltransferase, partial [Rudaea sp.]
EKFNFLYEENGELVALLFTEPKKEASFEVLIHPHHRTAELENSLIEWGEQTQHAHFGTEDIEWVMDVASFDRLRQQVLTKRGYRIEDQAYMISTVRALNVPIPESTLPPGFNIRSSTEADVEQLCAVHMSAFNSRWTVEEYRRVMRTPGFDPARELVVVAPDGQIAAFLVYWPDPVSKSGLFEPVGCGKEFQRRGLTRALLYEGMRRMVDVGMDYALVLHHTEVENPASGALYKSVGFLRLFDYYRATKKRG